MNAPEDLEVLEGYARFRPTGATSFVEIVGKVVAVITCCREQGIRRLLIDVTQLTGFAPPETIERFDMGKAIAEAGQAAVKVAMVAPPEFLDPQRLGATVARNRGLLAAAFESQEAALAWLLDPKAR